jgi:DNA-binding NarL/FixJ family response regulator
MIKTLIVDDNADFRQSFVAHLYQRFPDMVIAEAGNTAEALQRAGPLEPHLVFVDIHMPGESGFELVRKIKASKPQVVIAILTNYDFPEYRDAAHQAGADHFFSKGASSTEDIVALVESTAPARD